MMFNKVPDKEIVRAFDISLILYAEHSFNVSTFTAFFWFMVEQLQVAFQIYMEQLLER